MFCIVKETKIKCLRNIANHNDGQQGEIEAAIKVKLIDDPTNDDQAELKYEYSVLESGAIVKATGNIMVFDMPRLSI